ncbi:unnamed protein product [Rotaria sp. Silwood2]|nr:unnamed protein product [Rotaria sp. Silwood2]CAF2880646.1 unnamed protein product [Rotaria sp. Silwood2]CAF3023453.1 unnamed protein product [Rotaria sp. Silwood2]CAF4219516.1 unnamed protein product [Rotaria sp. Silwood2]CAF4329367.1 unnamed protein product [Rotaria sp. Silwood2]
MLDAVNQYSSSTTQSTAAAFNINSLTDFPALTPTAQQLLNHPSNDFIDALVNILSNKMEKIIEAATSRIFKSLEQRLSKIEKTIAAVDNMIDDDASMESSNDSSLDNDNEIQVINTKQDSQQGSAQTNTTATQQQLTSKGVMSKPPNKKKATSKAVKRNRSPNSSLDATTTNS